MLVCCDLEDQNDGGMDRRVWRSPGVGDGGDLCFRGGGEQFAWPAHLCFLYNALDRADRGCVVEGKIKGGAVFSMELT